MTQSVEELVRIELSAKGYTLEDVKLNSEYQRFDRDGTKNGWLIGSKYRTKSNTEIYFAVFGDWKTQERYPISNWNSVSKSEEGEARKFYVKSKHDVEEKQREAQKEASAKAKQWWRKGTPAQGHKYLNSKGIEEITGVKRRRNLYIDELLIPLRNVHHDLLGLQRIDSNGKKLFLTGQANKGLFFLIPERSLLKNLKEIYVVEGVATGWSVHKSTNKVVACAMNAGNLSDVCIAIKDLNPLIKIIVAGDNDSGTPGNPGKTSAQKAASEVAGKYTVPTFMDGDTKNTDFNDLFRMSGPQIVKQQLEVVQDANEKTLSSADLANQFLKKNKLDTHESRLAAFRQEFYQYTGKFYKKRITSDLLNDVVRFIQHHPLNRKYAGKIKGADVLSNIEAAVNVKSDRLPPFWIEYQESDSSNIICVDNGLIDLAGVTRVEDIDLLPHTSDFFNRSCLPFSFSAEASCPTWNQFLNEMIPDLNTQKVLQEWFGYNLIFDTSFQKFAIFYGHGANGKSVCCTVLRCLLGSENMSAVPLEAFDPKRTFVLANTVGKLANIVEELNIDSKGAEGELKKYISGNPTVVERKNKEPFEMIPTARLTFATNTLPRFMDNTDGIWRRLLLFPFKQQILDASQQNRNLGKEEFWKNSGELPGILNWALEGLLRLRRQGLFSFSEEMKSALSEFQIDVNPCRKFLLEYCKLKPGSTLGTMDLYKLYKSVMIDSGHQPMSIANFSREVILTFNVSKSENSVSHDGAKVHVWYGLSFVYGGTDGT